MSTYSASVYNDCFFDLGSILFNPYITYYRRNCEPATTGEVFETQSLRTGRGQDRDGLGG